MQATSAHSFTGNRRFEIRNRVGQGAVGVVYDAFDHERRARVALKTLHSVSPEALLSLKKEFRAVQDIRHPNLVTVGELFEEHGVWFFSMEFVDGSHFVQYVRPHDPRAKQSMPATALPALAGATTSDFDEARIRATLPQLVRGLRALHDVGKLHRDVKPSNVLVTEAGRVVLLDFGLARDVLRDVDESDPGLVGTAAYMAPEQALGETLGAAADWYAVGVVLYHALTGRLPFYGALHEVLAKKVAREPPAPSTVVSGVPRDLDELCVDLLRIDPEKRPQGPEILERLGATNHEKDAASGAHQAAVFVGRSTELATLDEALVDVAGKHAVTVLVHGESGVGKSFLVRRFLAELHQRDRSTLVLASRCFERESVPYKAVDGAIDEISSYLAALDPAELARVLPAEASLLVRAFPVLGRVVAAAPDDVEIVDPKELRARMFAAVRELFTRIAARRRLVLAIDDLQWADKDSMALLAETMRPPDAPPMLVVATIRIATENRARGTDEYLDAMPFGGDVRHVHVEHLPREEARALVMRLIGDKTMERVAVDAIVDETKGHPLFIDELVRQRSSERRVKVLKLDDALWARVTKLEPAARRLLELICVAELPIAQAIAADAAALDLGQLFDLAGALRSANFVKTSGARPEDWIEPYHGRVREAVLAHLELPQRTAWHARLAATMEVRGSADPETLAMHWHAAGNPERAADYALRAADDARRTLAFERAARLYRFALEIGKHSREAARDLRRQLAESLTNAGYVAEAADVHLALADQAVNEAALDLRRRAAEQLLCCGRFDAGRAVLCAVLDAVGVYYPKSPLAVVLSVLLARLVLLARGVAFTPRDPASPPPAAALVRADAAWSAGAGFAMTDNIRGAYFQTRNLLFCLRLGDSERIARALAMEVCFRAAGGARARERTFELLAREWEIANRVATPEALAMASTSNGYAHYFVGEWREAKPHLEKAEELFRDKCIGVAFQVNSTRIMLYRVLGYLGDLRGLAARVPAVLREVERQSDHYSVVNLQAGPMALLGLAAGEPQRVRDAIESITPHLSRDAFLIQHYFALMARCQIDLYGGDGAAAFGRLQAAWPALRRSLLLRVQAIRIAALEQRCRCALAAAAGRTSARADLLRAAEADAKRLGQQGLPWGDAASTMLRGAIQAAHGRKDEAIATLADAGRLYDALDMKLCAAASRWRSGELRGGPQGDDEVSKVEAILREEGVRDPARMVATLLPPVVET